MPKKGKMDELVSLARRRATLNGEFPKKGDPLALSLACQRGNKAERVHTSLGGKRAKTPIRSWPSC